MNTYYSYLGRLLEGRTPIDKPGYYLLYEDQSAGFRPDKPEGVEIVTAERFADALAEGCRTILRTFADSPDNKEVYAFNLYADEHYSIFVYLNTLERFRDTLDRYRAKHPDTYATEDRILGLKYSQGDFGFQYWQDHMGDHGSIVDAFEKLAYSAADLDEDEEAPDGGGEETALAFEAGIIKDGFYVLALRAMRRLIADGAFDLLDRTEDFVAFACTGNDNLDFSRLVPKTVSQDLLHRVFPIRAEQELRFRESMKEYRQLAVGEAIEFWSEAIHDGCGSAAPFSYGKSEMDVFLQLEPYGYALAEECVARLDELAGRERLDRRDYERMYFYVEALHFAGPLTEEQAERCRALAERLVEQDGELKPISRELLSLAGRL